MSEVTVVLNFRAGIAKLRKINEYFPTAKVDKYLLMALRGLHGYCIDPEEIDPNALAEEYFVNALERQMTSAMFWDNELLANDGVYVYDEEDTESQLPPQVVELAKESVRILADVVRGISYNLNALFLSTLVFNRINSLRIDTAKEHIVITGILNP